MFGLSGEGQGKKKSSNDSTKAHGNLRKEDSTV
jgi:hypothetical protein